jgi:hypothetical protein
MGSQHTPSLHLKAQTILEELKQLEGKLPELEAKHSLSSLRAAVGQQGPEQDLQRVKGEVSSGGKVG